MVLSKSFPLFCENSSFMRTSSSSRCSVLGGSGLGGFGLGGSGLVGSHFGRSVRGLARILSSSFWCSTGKGWGSSSFTAWERSAAGRFFGGWGGSGPGWWTLGK
jgi:hypothetical protein